VAVGESSFWSVEPVGFRKAIRDFSNATVIVSVSSIIKRSLMDRLKIPEEKIIVLPNGVDLSLFYPRNRMEIRQKYCFPANKFIIAFTGHFDERKGPHRLLSAVSGMDKIGLIFIGDGDIPVEDEKIVFKGVMEHSKVPELLSAADIFVLPTLCEGSCNAILEALACGLPIITSNGEFNDDIVDDNVALRIDPENIGEIREAIIKLRNNDELREEMSSKALESVRQFDINMRACKILERIAAIADRKPSNNKVGLLEQS
jgi:glycosyltransferase involved in cell wall biosynthesis